MVDDASEDADDDDGDERPSPMHPSITEMVGGVAFNQK